MLRDQGVSFQAYISQISYLLFLKMDEERVELIGEPSPLPAGSRRGDMLRSSPEIGRDDVEPLAVFLVMDCTSMLQAAFMSTDADKETIRAQMHAMAPGCRREMRPRESVPIPAFRDPL